MAGRRKVPRKWQHSSSQTILWTSSVAALILTLCLCAFNFDLNGTVQTRLDTCRSTCDERLQSAALESSVSSSLSPSAINALFLNRGAHQQPGSQGRAEQPSERNNLKHSQQQAVPGRPRRLPTLIKILTGFGDEPYWNERSSSGGNGDSSSVKIDKPIIARIERPDFLHQAHQRRRGTGAESLSHEATVQVAAAAAAAAVWTRSLRIFCNNRMHGVNSEWDAALRWIAGWDQQQQQMPSSTANDSEQVRVNDNGSLNGGVSNDMSQEGFNTFVDDLARMLETCIRECVEDEHFDARLGNESTGEVALRSFIGDMVLRSFLAWIVGTSFPKISFGKLDMISAESRFIIVRAFHLVASSVAVFAIHSLWSWASPMVSNWYSSLGYSESPEWLLEHEKEIEQAKSSSRSRQRKKAKRRQLTKHSGSKAKSAPGNGVVQNESPTVRENSCDDDLKPNGLAVEPIKIGGKQLQSGSDAEDWQKERASKNAILTSKDSASVSQGSITVEDIPSVISYPSTSASSSPSMKPIGSHLEDREISCGLSLRGSPQPVLGLNSQLIPQGTPLFPQLPAQSILSVPTQEQRNEAAKQLREFQNAQLQRILLQRKLSQNSNVSRLSAPTAAPQTSQLLSGRSFHSLGNGQQQNKVLRPPPGLPCPSETPYNPDLHNQLDNNGFLADNELFLSKLLDDDDDDDVEEAALSSLQIGIRSVSPESSLDPAAAPFISGKVGGTGEQKEDCWKSNTGVNSLKESSPSRMIKGVYGGSVW